MKKLFLLFVLLICCTRVIAAPFNKIIFFGDSLTDNGNLYALLLNMLPKSPPYYKGRFSNGPTWAEDLGNHYYDQFYTDYKVYAWGGATALFHLPTTSFIPPTNLNMEVDKYLVDATFRDKSKTLFTIWIGGNDYLYYSNQNGETLTTDVVEKISDSVEKLVKNGGRTFLLLNLPDLSATPHAKKHDIEERVKYLTDLHNLKLANAIKMLEEKYPQIKIVSMDVFSVFNDLTANPEKYNKKYNTNILNTTQACWEGKYYFKKNFTATTISEELKQNLRNDPKATADLDVDAISEFILKTPAMKDAYLVGEASRFGYEPCSNPNQYVFWDTIHPTAIIHNILALIVADTLAANNVIPYSA